MPVSAQKDTSDSPEHISFFQLLKNSGMLILLFPIMVHGMLKDGVTTWVPTYISENFLTSPSFSVLITTMLPVFNLAGAYLARYIYQKCKNNETKAASVFSNFPPWPFLFFGFADIFPSFSQSSFLP